MQLHVETASTLRKALDDDLHSNLHMIAGVLAKVEEQQMEYPLRQYCISKFLIPRTLTYTRSHRTYMDTFSLEDGGIQKQRLSPILPWDFNPFKSEFDGEGRSTTPQTRVGFVKTNSSPCRVSKNCWLVSRVLHQAWYHPSKNPSHHSRFTNIPDTEHRIQSGICFPCVSLENTIVRNGGAAHRSDEVVAISLPRD